MSKVIAFLLGFTLMWGVLGTRAALSSSDCWDKRQQKDDGSIVMQCNGYRYERRGEVQYGNWYRCDQQSCRHIASPIVEDPSSKDVFLKEIPDQQETDARYAPNIVDENYICRRYGGWVCSQDHCSSNFRYACMAKDGFVGISPDRPSENGHTAPDGMVYVQQDRPAAPCCYGGGSRGAPSGWYERHHIDPLTGNKTK